MVSVSRPVIVHIISGERWGKDVRYRSKGLCGSWLDFGVVLPRTTQTKNDCSPPKANKIKIAPLRSAIFPVSLSHYSIIVITVVKPHIIRNQNRYSITAAYLVQCSIVSIITILITVI